LLFGSLEGVQRVRYAVRQHDWRWLAYGVVSRYGATHTLAARDNVAEQLAALDPRFRYVACVGGSATKGIYNDEAHRFPFLLERLIDAERPGRFRVLNLGKGGAASEHYRRVLDATLGAVTPAAVV